MTEAEFFKALLTTLPNLGVGFIFLYLYFTERKHNTSMTERIIGMYAESIVASKDITFALENNTQVIKTLVDQVNKLGA